MKHVAFRVDASLDIGTGHLMRCLTLADELREHGAACTFVTQARAGNPTHLVTERGHRLLRLPTPAVQPARPAHDSSLAHAHWLQGHWETDAAATQSALAAHRPDWLIVDHYALDAAWEAAMRPVCDALMVIDDLADRAHQCDLLLDQNLGRSPGDYVQLTPPRARLLIGPGHALLRPEFARQRSASLDRRRAPRLEHLLITMGGIDRDNATGQVLEALGAQPLPESLRITVVMGPAAPAMEAVRSAARRIGRPTEVLVGVRDMAALMSSSDLAIGAAGSTAWERCCLGVPTLQMVLADNQAPIARALAQAGAAITTAPETFAGDLGALLSKETAVETLHALSQAAATLTDGRGAQRTVDAMQEQAP